MDELFDAFEGEQLAEGGEYFVSQNAENDNTSKIRPEDETAQANDGRQTQKREIGNTEVLSESSLKKAKVECNEPLKVDENAGIQSQTESNKVSKVEKPPAKKYPFELDGFQKQSIEYLEKNESVLVAAHTSAGKTAVAEYAIAMAFRDKQRVIYTSPIKALSNQKYRDLASEFSDVGLLTGDVTINPNASCLVMTTEILRSMLYRGSEIIREVAWAIFDEVHYMRDRERGVVWEESIVLLPHKVRYVFLSATIPNAKQFAGWISKVHHQPCHVVYTDYRPTPLQHYMFPSGGEGVFLIVDEKGKFKDENLQRAMAKLQTSNLEDEVNDGSAKSRDLKRKRQNRHADKQGDLARLVKMVMERKYDPVIVFSFSKKECEKYAKKISKYALNSQEESELVGQIFENAMDSLNDDDKNLPQVVNVLPFLKRGIGIHHGGLLPILKEIVEIMFGEGLLQVLFATETFAMGINMPAKTVIFTAMRKFDGTETRFVRSGEYIQMSGRAGRRGLDDRGIVIQMVDQVMEPEQCKQIMNGKADPLSSTFHLGYNMLLNLIRVEDADPEFIIRNSLFAYQQEQALPELEKQLKELKETLEESKMEPEMEAKFVQYHAMVLQFEKIRSKIRQLVIHPDNALGFMRSGRLVKVSNKENLDWWGIVTSYRMEERQINIEGKTIQEDYAVIDVILACDKATPEPFPEKLTTNRKYDLDSCKIRTVSIPLTELEGISTICIHVPKDNRSDKGRKVIMLSVNEILSRFKDGIPLLDPIEDMKIKDPNLPELIRKTETLQDRLTKDEIHTMDKELKEKLYTKYLEKFDLRAQIKLVEKEIRCVKTMPLKDKLKRMKVVLRRLGLVDKENVIQLKGRVACEISTADELVVCELLLGGAFNDMKPEVAAAMLSCVIFTEKGEEDLKVPEELSGALKKLRQAARRVGEVERDANLETDPDEYVKRFKPDLMEAVFRWCRGAKFSEICQICECFEGTIIRCVRRLVELLRQLVVAAKVIGDQTLQKIFTDAIKLIKRDIIFAGSLYL